MTMSASKNNLLLTLPIKKKTNNGIKKADLGQFMSLPKIVGLLNVVIAQQVG